MKRSFIEFILFSLIGGFIWYILNCIIKSTILSFFIALVLNAIIGYVSGYVIGKFSLSSNNSKNEESYEIKINHKLLT